MGMGVGMDEKKMVNTARHGRQFGRPRAHTYASLYIPEPIS